MYLFARRHFGETAGRAALLAGAFWYELVGFAHKPMTEFVATAPLVALLALCARPSVDNARRVWKAAFLAVLTAAIRLQYAPAALLLLGIVFLRTGKRIRLTLAVAGFAAAFGVFDAVTWNGGLFHSYVTIIRYHLMVGPLRTGESPAYQYLLWLTLAGLGLSLLCLAAALRRLRRYGLLLGLIALVVLFHSLQTHKEYRYIFAVIPLWLLIGADLAVRLAALGDGRRRPCRSCSRRVRGRFAGGNPERPALSGPGVPSLVEGDRSGELRPQPGPDLPGLSLSCPRTWRQRDMAGRPSLSKLPSVLLPSPRDTLLRPVHREASQRESGGSFFPGQPHRVRGLRLFRSRILPGPRIRPSSHLAPRSERTSGPAMVELHSCHCVQFPWTDHEANRPGRTLSASQLRDPICRWGRAIADGREKENATEQAQAIGLEGICLA